MSLLLLKASIVAGRVIVVLPSGIVARPPFALQMLEHSWKKKGLNDNDDDESFKPRRRSEEEGLGSTAGEEAAVSFSAAVGNSCSILECEVRVEVSAGAKVESSLVK